jgi:signal transduction histidine kinase
MHATADGLSDASILIVDDQEANVRLLARLLRQAGFRRLHGMQDPRVALARFAELAPDLVLLDLSMPHVDGFAFMEQMRPLVAADDYLPVLVVTANVLPEVKRRALAAGARDFLAKPLDAVEVVLRVRNLLETRRLHRLLRAHNADLEAEIRRRTGQLVRAAKLATVGELLGGVAHELNNPLTIVLGYAQMIKRRGGDEVAREQATKLEQAASRCARIVKNFLAMARERPPERGPVAVNEVIRQAVDLLGHQLRTGAVEVVLALDPAEPVLDADGHQLHQLVVNLVNNARQAMAGREGLRRITVTTRADAGTVITEVSDTGPGIPPELQERIFDAFFTTKPVGEGTGLGLSLCRTIVDAHGGTLSVDGAAGGGARFTIALPVGRPDGPPRPDGGDAPRATPLDVLVVDDEAEVAQTLSTVLEHDGHRVALCAGAADALARAAERAYDVVLLDVRMPDLDGIRCAEALESAAPWTRGRIALCTGDTLNPRVTAFVERSGTPTLAKPVAIAELRRLLATYAR